MGPKRNSNSVVGLDIEPGFLAAAAVTRNGSVRVERSMVGSVPPGALADGEVSDVAALSEALREMFADTDLPRRVRVGVANARVAVRTLELPPITDAKDLDAAIRFQAADQLPIPAAQAIVDYHSLGLVETDAGTRTRVVVVGAQRDMVTRLLDAVRGAGLKPEGVDLSAFAMIRALHEGSAAPVETTLYVAVGGITNLAVARGSTCIFTRMTPNGSEAMAADLAARRGLSIDESRRELVAVGLEQPLEALALDPAVAADARAVLSEGVRRIADDVRTSLEFYGLQEGAQPVERVVLTGAGGAIPGFVKTFGEHLGVDVELGAVEGSLAGAAGSVLAVAAGLGIEEGLS